MSHEEINQQFSRSLEIQKSLYEKLNELEKQLENVRIVKYIIKSRLFLNFFFQDATDDSIKEKLKYTKFIIDEMEEKEVIFSIRLAEAEKNWRVLFRGENGTTGESDKNFTENLDPKQFYKEKYDQISREVKLQ